MGQICRKGKNGIFGHWPSNMVYFAWCNSSSAILHHILCTCLKNKSIFRTWKMWNHVFLMKCWKLPLAHFENTCFLDCCISSSIFLCQLVRVKGPHAVELHFLSFLQFFIDLFQNMVEIARHLFIHTFWIFEHPLCTLHTFIVGYLKMIFSDFP
jgi:hypothetical protein